MLKNSLTIPEFCNRESISRAMFYKLHKQGLAPRIMKIGRLTRISIESATEWRQRMEKLSGEGK
jgi:predicted DNA-binding transcriptional regulator AlpA